MDILLSLGIIAGIFLWIFFLDRFFKSCSHYAYIQFLNATGLKIRLCQLQWTTTTFNGFFHRWGTKHPRFISIWFNLGCIVSLALLPVSIYVLFHAFYQNFSPPKSGVILIQPVLPGVNLPASEIWFYTSTIFINSVIHEMGHALAAGQEDVPLINVGATLIFVLPVAFVQLNTDRLFSLNPWKRLKIFCAGVWHNLLLTVCALLIYFSLPTLFSVGYYYGRGVVVTGIAPKAPVGGERGLHVNDQLTKVNECDLTDESSWFRCLTHQKPAFCIEADLVHRLDESIPLGHDSGVVSCCNSDNKSHLCFEYLDVKDSILELPPFACLPGRSVIENGNFCTSNPHLCPKDSYCFRPILANDTSLFKIKRVGEKDVIYIGSVYDFSAVRVSSYIPKFSLKSTVPDAVSKFFEYLIMFSEGFAILNILPCLFMDGHHIINTLFHIALSNHLRTTHIKVFSAIVTAFFSFVLVLHCFLVVWTKFS